MIEQLLHDIFLYRAVAIHLALCGHISISFLSATSSQPKQIYLLFSAKHRVYPLFFFKIGIAWNKNINRGSTFVFIEAILPNKDSFILSYFSRSF